MKNILRILWLILLVGALQAAAYPLAEALAKLAHNFEYRRILTLTQEAV